METVNWNELIERSRGMTDLELHGAIKDCLLAGDASWALEKAGNSVLKSQGFYHDEASVYRQELKNRRRTLDAWKDAWAKEKGK